MHVEWYRINDLASVVDSFVLDWQCAAEERQTQTQAQTQAPENDMGNIGNFLCGKFCTGVKLIWDRFSSFDFDARTQGRRQA